MENIGHFQIEKLIGRGGMGEVFLAYDPKMDRRIALKRIKPNLFSSKKACQRFLQEAIISGKLTHPSIIPIYSIYQEENNLYYTMPFIEGLTLKQIIHKAKIEETKNALSYHIDTSIPYLLRIFINVCQAVFYAHSKKIIHRDIKLENIIIGKFGEVLIIDWGIATYKDTSPTHDFITNENDPLTTQAGKVLGTLNYLAPERAHHMRANESSDIYALGVILYALLTLELPFQRENVDSFREMMEYEELIEPSEKAPYRDIPYPLSEIAKKCLTFDKNDRYNNVKSLIADLEHYVEGTPNWTLIQSLSLDAKEDWAMQEHVLFSQYTSITRELQTTEWSLLAITKNQFSGNCKIVLEVSLSRNSAGLAILLNIPIFKERKGICDGFGFWLGSESNPSIKLFRSSVEILSRDNLCLLSDKSYQICIEKIDCHIRLYIDHHLVLHYGSYLPFTGAHIGLLYKDTFFTIRNFCVYEGSQYAMVNCLSIPDAFLSIKDFNKALVEYRRIALSFHGRMEGREAVFRAGITLLEKSKLSKKPSARHNLLYQAIEEFEKLRGSPSAPLEYLGKSLVYQELGELEEEVKCLELAFRKYPTHPLEHILEEHVIFRLHETASRNRKAAYYFLLLALRLLPNIFQLHETKNLLIQVKRNREPLSCMEKPDAFSSSKAEYLHLAIELCFWLNSPLLLLEIYDKHLSELDERNILSRNIIVCLIALHYYPLALNLLKQEEKYLEKEEYSIACRLATNSIDFDFQLSPRPSFFVIRLLLSSIYQRLNKNNASSILNMLDQIYEVDLPKNLKLTYHAMQIWAHLLLQNLTRAGEIFDKYSIEYLTQPKSILFLLYGLYLWVREGQAIAFIQFDILPDVAFPYTYELLAYCICNKLYNKDKLQNKLKWKQSSFLWENLCLLKQLSLVYSIQNDTIKALYFEKKIKTLWKHQKIG
ncbi:MAG: protein kinase domain-containing protein [Chlamydiales bacterium]